MSLSQTKLQQKRPMWKLCQLTNTFWEIGEQESWHLNVDVYYNEFESNPYFGDSGSNRICFDFSARHFFRPFGFNYLKLLLHQFLSASRHDAHAIMKLHMTSHPGSHHSKKNGVLRKIFWGRICFQVDPSY